MLAPDFLAYGALDGMDSKDSLLGANQIQGCFLGGSLGCDGAVGFERRGMGAYTHHCDQERWATGGTKGLEEEHDGAEPDECGEPSLGSLDRVMNQERSWHRENPYSIDLEQGERGWPRKA